MVLRLLLGTHRLSGAQTRKDDDVINPIKRAPATPPVAGLPPPAEQASGSGIEAEDMTQEAHRATAEGQKVGQNRSLSPKEEARRKIILEGDVWKGVLAVALPSVATMVLQTTNGLLDSFFVGSLGPQALAAITVGGSLMFALMAAAMAVSVGTTALVARFVGEGNYTDARTATKQSILLAILISFAVGIPMLFLRYPLLRALGLHEEALHLAARYLLVTILGMPSLFLMLIMNGAFRGLGDTVRPFWVSLGANCVHAGFNYLLIFGHFGFPRMGLPGGALALVLSQIMAAALYFVFLPTTPLYGALTGSWRFDLDWGKRIARIGLPASAQQLIRVGSMLAFQSLLAHSADKDTAVAALGVGLRSESIAFMPGFGYAIAASAFVGQNLGARHVKRANTGAWAATWQAVAVMSFMGLLFATFADPFSRVFIKHAAGETAIQAAQVDEAIRLTAAYLHVAMWSEPFLALGMVLTGALQGAGETVSPTAITVVTMVCLRLPLGWFLLRHFGVHGAWWAMTVSTIAQGILTVFLFRQGNWRKKRL